jgi:hypothetical protein
MERHDMKDMAWKGKTWHGNQGMAYKEWHGKARHEMHGMAWKGKAWHGMERKGMAWKGNTWKGKAWKGKTRQHGKA